MFKIFNLLAIFAILLMFASSFTEEDSSNTVTDIDGNVYQTLKIGTQTWMVENLKTTKFNDGTSIPNVVDSTAWSNLTAPGYCFYDNDTTYKNNYGALYNWYTVNAGKLAPKGWHVPTDEEWGMLEDYLTTNGYNYDKSTTGNKIAKSIAATTNWSSYTGTGAIGHNLTKNNTSGFAAQPGGYRYGFGAFNEISYEGHWWSSTESSISTTSAWHRYLLYDSDYLYQTTKSMSLGFSIRCLRDY